MKSFQHIAFVAVVAGFFSAAVHGGQAPPAVPPAPVVRLQVVLTDGSKIHGTPVEFSALPLTLEFTKIDVPLAVIAQASFNSDRSALAIRFRNNDTLTGKLELQRIKIQTAYGLADIPMDRVATIAVAVAAAAKP